MNQIFGWKSIDDLAKDIYGSIFSGLLDGYLVFAYRNQRRTGTLKELVISKRLDNSNYIIGIRPFSGGWSGFLPNMPVEYLMEVSYQDLIENKTEKEVIDSFIENINKYESRK